MFAGEFPSHAEAGGLFLLPPIVLAAFPPPEEAVGRQVVVLKSLDPGLWLYSAQTWELNSRPHASSSMPSRAGS
jgi:hypothetical protein